MNTDDLAGACEFDHPVMEIFWTTKDEGDWADTLLRAEYCPDCGAKLWNHTTNKTE